VDNAVAIWDHTVLPATWQQWLSNLYPSQSWYSILCPQRDARLSWSGWWLYPKIVYMPKTVTYLNSQQCWLILLTMVTITSTAQLIDRHQPEVGSSLRPSVLEEFVPVCATVGHRSHKELCSELLPTDGERWLDVRLSYTPDTRCVCVCKV